MKPDMPYSIGANVISTLSTEETVLGQIASKMDYFNMRLTTAVNRVNYLADRTFGSIPLSKHEATKVSEEEGNLANVWARLNDLGLMIDLLDEATERFAKL